MIAAGIVLLTVGGVDLTRRSLTGMRRAIVLAVLGLVVLIASAGADAAVWSFVAVGVAARVAGGVAARVAVGVAARAADGVAFGVAGGVAGVAFSLTVDRAQSDPFAPPSRMHVTIPAAVAGFPPEAFSTKARAEKHEAAAEAAAPVRGHVSASGCPGARR